METKTMTTTKIIITDIQRAVLETAAVRVGGLVWPLPEALGLKKGSAVLVTKALLGKGMVKERRARANEVVWREDEQEKPMAAVITRAGLKAVGGIDSATPAEEDAPAAQGGKRAATPDAPSGAEPRRMPRAETKLAVLVELLTRDGGATVEEMVAATGWQAHTVRGGDVGRVGEDVRDEDYVGEGRGTR